VTAEARIIVEGSCFSDGVGPIWDERRPCQK